MRIRIRPNVHSSAGLLVYIVFQLLFLGAGGFALGYAYLQYREGAAAEAVLIPGGLGALFVGMSLVQIVRAWRRHRAQPASADVPQHEEAPWHVRPEWRRAELIEAHDEGGKEKFFAIVWNVFTWPLAGIFIYTEFQSPDPDGAVLFVLVFPLVGLFLGWRVVRRVLHRRKFGTATLVMEDMPGRLGRPLHLRLKTGVRPDEAPADGFHVRLSCYRRAVRYTRDSDGDRRRTIEKDLLWRDEKRVRGRPSDAGDRLEVPVTFELPSAPPPSTPEKRENRILWAVEAEADVPGLDFQTTFEIPVFAPEQGTEPPTQGADAQDRADQKDAAVMEEHPYAGYELGTTFDEPVSSRISMRRLPGGGLELHFAAGRNKLSGGMFAGFALIMAVIAVVAFVQGAILGTLFFLLPAGLSGYGAWTLVATASTLTIEGGTVTLVRGPLGRGAPVRFSCADLADVSVEASGHAGSTTYYNLTLHRLDAAAQQQAAAGEEAAEKVTQFIEQTGLVQGAEAEQAAEKIQQRIHEQSTQLTVARGLANKQEADWIAATIQQAAQREATFS